MRIAVLAVAATLSLASPAVASHAPMVPSVGLRPLHPAPHSPNGGQWFVMTLAPGHAATQQALVINTAARPQTILLYARDLVFAANGTPRVVAGGATSGVEQWTQVDSASVVVPAHGAQVVGFRVSVPPGAVPGDHIGVLVAQSAPQVVAGQRVIVRIATRVYVTVPGVATRGMRLIGLRHTVHSPFWPTSVSVVATLRNTGQTALAPAVRIDGRPAAGSTDLLAESVENYAGTARVGWWGAHLQLSVVASARGVPPRTRSISLWVINWVVVATLLVGLVGVSVGVASVASTTRRHRAERRALHARIADLEARSPAAAAVGTSRSEQRGS